MTAGVELWVIIVKQSLSPDDNINIFPPVSLGGADKYDAIHQRIMQLHDLRLTAE